MSEWFGPFRLGLVGCVGLEYAEARLGIVLCFLFVVKHVINKTITYEGILETDDNVPCTRS